MIICWKTSVWLLLLLNIGAHFMIGTDSSNGPHSSSRANSSHRIDSTLESILAAGWIGIGIGIKISWKKLKIWFQYRFQARNHNTSNLYRYGASFRPGSGKLLQRYDHIVAGTLKFIFLYIQVFLNSYPHPTFIDWPARATRARSRRVSSSWPPWVCPPATRGCWRRRRRRRAAWRSRWRLPF